MPKKLDLTGETFGRLTVVEKGEPYICPKGNKQVRWLCKCSCGSGKEVEVVTANLRSGKTKSCGCLQKEKLAESNITHAKSKTPEYNTWKSMKSRCHNVTNKYYEDYGGRGIEVCGRWLESFENFLEDMGEKPSDKHSIERIDVNGNYCPENCVWIAGGGQAKNRRKRSDNRSGVTGVNFYNKGGCCYYLARWVDIETDKQKSKTFSVNKYGKEEAFRLACGYRQKMIDELNKQGVGYSENHGK